MSRPNSETVTVTLTPAQCRLAYREAQRLGSGGDVSAELLDQLNEAEALSLWLRDQVRLDVSPRDAALVRDLLRTAQPRGFVAAELATSSALATAK